jgi:hypothetical protein
MDNTAQDLSASSIVLASDRLKVEIARPGSVYKRTRFDWTGFITQITLDGSHTFCVPEDYDPAKGTGGVGLCGEYGNEKAVGYSDALPGESFPKLGIGLLKRPPEERYNFFAPHEIDRLFPIEIETGPDSARFVAEPLDCRGYAVRQSKTVSLEGNWLTIANQLENRGSKPIHTHEYCHNFIGIDNQTVGPDFRLCYPFAVTFERTNPEAFRSFLPPLLRKITPGFVLELLLKRMMGSSVLQIQGQEVRWTSIPTRAFFCRPQGFFKTQEAQWELTHLPSGVTVREYDDFMPAKMALWGAKHVISPEVYIDIDLEPGQSQSWSRRYQFEAGR